MAKIETTFIRPKEIFNVDDGTAKVVYDGYQNNPHEIELKENLEGDVKAEINAEFVPNDNNNVVFKDSENVEHELITNEGFPTEFNEAFLPALKANQLISTTWQGLKDLRDNKQLIAGSLYRITDYQCTTTQENTRSAGHQFDIVLLALSANKLAEEGWAMMNESNVYDVTFNDGVRKCWIYITDEENKAANVVIVDTLLGIEDVGYGHGDELTIDEENKTATLDYHIASLTIPNLTYNYFQNSNLSAWKVWYCLDNDKSRFAWADDGETEGISTNETSFSRYIEGDTDGYFAWISKDELVVFTDTPSPKVGDMTYDDTYIGDLQIIAVSGFGRGVIYRLIDEFNNDVAYDFKNVQYVRKVEGGQFDSEGSNKWMYTFTLYFNETEDYVDFSLKSYGENFNGGLWGTYDNKINESRTDYDVPVKLNDIVLLSSDIDDYYSCDYNSFNNCRKLSLGSMYSVEHNLFNDCNNITTYSVCSSNILVHCSSNEFAELSGSNLYFSSHIQLNQLASSNLFYCSSFNYGNTQGNLTNCTITHGSEIEVGVITLSKVKINECMFINIVKDLTNSILTHCEYFELTSTQSTSGQNVLKNINVESVKGIQSSFKTISHNTLNDTFITTYVPQDSTTVEV